MGQLNPAQLNPAAHVPRVEQLNQRLKLGAGHERNGVGDDSDWVPPGYDRGSS